MGASFLPFLSVLQGTNAIFFPFLFLFAVCLKVWRVKTADGVKKKSIFNCFWSVAQRVLRAILLKCDECIIMESEHDLKYIKDMA